MSFYSGSQTRSNSFSFPNVVYFISATFYMKHKTTPVHAMLPRQAKRLDAHRTCCQCFATNHYISGTCIENDSRIHSFLPNIHQKQHVTGAQKGGTYQKFQRNEIIQLNFITDISIQSTKVKGIKRVLTIKEFSILFLRLWQMC